MAFKFGMRSLEQLEGVKEPLVDVSKRSLELSAVDFGVFSGLRSREEQYQLWLKRSSQLDGSPGNESKHQFGEAVDLVPWILGRYRWQWASVFQIADAVQKAANELGVPIRWGGSWSELTNTDKSPIELNREYVRKREAQGRKAFADGVHFELIT